MAQILAQRTRLVGRIGWTFARLADLVGDYGATGVALAPSMTAAITDPLASAQGTPLGPIAQALSNAVRRASGQFDATGSLRLVNQPGGGAVRVERPEAVSASGARIEVSGGDGVTYYWPSNRLRIDGSIAASGGGCQRRHHAKPAARPVRDERIADIAPWPPGSERSWARSASRPTRRVDRGQQLALLDGPYQRRVTDCACRFG